MCDPTTLAISQMALSAAGSMSAINDQNEAAAANRRNAITAQNNKIEDQGRQYIEQNRSLIQGGFDSVLAGRAAQADAYTAAIANGVQGNSVKAMLSDQRMASQRNTQRTNQEMSSLSDQTDANFRNIRAGTQGKINSVSTTSFGLGDAAKALTPIVRYGME